MIKGEGLYLDLSGIEVLRYLFFPLQTWESDMLTIEFFKVYKYIPDLIRNARKIANLARALIDRGNLDAQEKIRPERLINWFRNTSTLIVGNVAYYVRNVMLIHGELESIVSSSYKHERSYWGLTGNLDVIPYISVEDRYISITSADSNISMCFILEIDNELTKILINNGVLRAELTILVDCAGNINIVEFEGYSYRCYKTRHIALGLYENEMQITIYGG